MGYLQALVFSICWCVVNNQQSTESDLSTHSSASNVLNKLCSPIKKEKKLLKRIKTEPVEPNVSTEHLILNSFGLIKTEICDDSVLQKVIKTETSDDVPQKVIKTEICEDVPQKVIKTEPLEFITSAPDAPELSLTLKKDVNKRKNSNRIRSNSHYRKSAAQKETPSDLKNKRFTQEQIRLLLDLTVKNKDSYRLFVSEYLKSVYPNDLPGKVFEEFSYFNMVNQRCCTIRKTTTFGITTFLTEDDYESGKLNTDFRAYYLNNDVLFIEEEAKKRNKILKRLYICYERGSASYNVTNSKELSLFVYNQITENIISDVINKEKNLLYANKMFNSINNYPLCMDDKLRTRKIFVYNLLIYASTRLDSNVLTVDNYWECFRLELDKIFTGLLLPEETDYMHALIFLSYLENEKNKRKLFIKKLNSAEYKKSIAFYHFKYLYYVFYNIHRLGPFTEHVFYKSYIDFPDSLAFLSNVIDRFLTNTLYLLYYKYKINVEVQCANNKFSLLVHILMNGFKYLNKDAVLEVQLETLLSDTIRVLGIKL